MRALIPKRRKRRPDPPRRQADLNLLRAYQRAYADWSLTVGYTQDTATTQAQGVLRFIAWCEERGLDQPQDITRPILERYQRHLYHYRKHNGAPLSVVSQINLLTPLKAWFRWLTRQNHILYNPASDLDLPKKPKRLPKGLLSVAEIESVINQCDVSQALGIRNRAILETLYSTGIRRAELIHLKLYDVNIEQGSLMVRAGKGNKDRLVPIGARACAWIDRYLLEVRPELASGADDLTLFLYDDGTPFNNNRLGDLVKRHLQHAGVTQAGACHLFRHAMATHMLENGADIRFIQTMLGHNDLNTTQIYTQVSLSKLKEIHNATHPARLTRQAVRGAAPAARDALLDALDAEGHDEDGAAS